jgi:nucleoid-associated protein YgaU
MRSIVWLGSAMAVLLLAIAAVIGLRGTLPSSRPAQPATAPASQPAAPAAPSAAAKPLSFDIVRIDPLGKAVIAGRAMPGDRVRVLDGDKPLGEVTADARGEWVLLPEAPIAPGNRQLGLEATPQDGGPVRRSGDVVALTVLPPTASQRNPSTLAVLLPGDASQPSRVLQKPASSSDGNILSLDTAEYGAHNQLMLSGRATPGARLNIYAGDELLGAATADAAGKWSLVSPQKGPTQGVELRLDELAADGTVAHRIAAPFQPPTATALAPGGTYTVQQGNSLWLIARQLFGQGTRYTAIYTVNREQIRDPNKIYPGQLFKLPKS